jgi:hypothetical protein
MKFRVITFIENGDMLHGYFFYVATSDSVSESGHIFGMKELTLHKAIAKLKERGVDAIANYKMNMAVYYLW